VTQTVGNLDLVEQLHITSKIRDLESLVDNAGTTQRTAAVRIATRCLHLRNHLSHLTSREQAISGPVTEQLNELRGRVDGLMEHVPKIEEAKRESVFTVPECSRGRDTGRTIEATTFVPDVSLISNSGRVWVSDGTIQGTASAVGNMGAVGQETLSFTGSLFQRLPHPL
jgi:hypothetical protein